MWIEDKYVIVIASFCLKNMGHERTEHLPLQSILRNGDIISQQQFTQLILEQEGIQSLTLLTQSYMTPKGDGGSAIRIHNHLLRLANQGTSIHVGIDHNYAHLIAPNSDFPNILAPFFMDRDNLEAEQLRQRGLYEDLAKEPNIDLVFHGEKDVGILPFSKFDHRKILRVEGSPIQDFAVIYGFNIDATLDHDVDCGIYITDPDALEWIDAQPFKEQSASPEKVIFDGFTFITRETLKKGGRLVDQEVSNIIQEAQSNILFCGQFIPDGVFLQNLINAADRGVEVAIVSNRPSLSRQPMYVFTRKVIERKLASASRSRSNLYLYVPKDPNVFVHAKALLTDTDNPSQTRVIAGTDNLSNPMFGYIKTREVLVELTDPNYISNLYQYLKKNVLIDLERV